MRVREHVLADQVAAVRWRVRRHEDLRSDAENTFGLARSITPREIGCPSQGTRPAGRTLLLDLAQSLTTGCEPTLPMTRGPSR